MQVKRLEDVLGQPVLARSKGGSVELMPHGHYLLTRARQILALNDEARVFQKEIGRQNSMKFTPKIRFEIDNSFEQVQRIDDILRSINISED